MCQYHGHTEWGIYRIMPNIQSQTKFLKCAASNYSVLFYIVRMSSQCILSLSLLYGQEYLLVTAPSDTVLSISSNIPATSSSTLKRAAQIEMQAQFYHRLNLHTMDYSQTPD